MAVNQWIKSNDGSWYYLNSDGQMQKGWEEYNEKWYYLDSSCKMQIGSKSIDGKDYYFNADGEMAIGWIKESNNTWDYFDQTSGQRKPGWIKDTNGKWYYLKSNRTLRTGWTYDGDKRYYLNSEGEMQTGWVEDNGNWYYFNSKGEMQTGTVNIDGNDYEFNDRGQLQNDDEAGNYGEVYTLACGDGRGGLTKEQQKANAEYIYNYLSDKGWTKNAICALLGNIESESSLNPGSWEVKDVIADNVGYVLVQWSAASKFLDYAQITMEEADNMDAKDLMDKELEFILYEVEGGTDQWTSSYVGGMTFKEFTQSTDTAYNLAMKFIKAYEKPRDGNQPNRGKQAEDWYNSL